MNDFYFSLLFGALIIAVFSLDQFERPTYQRSQELTRVIKALLPSDLRSSRVYYPAYLFYVALLLLIYAALCIYGSVPLLKLLGFAVEGESARSVAPLMISLAMVGFAPAVPVLQRFEEKIRFAAHRLSGIPARLLYGCDVLNAQVLRFPEQKGYLIPDGDWERLRTYERFAAGALKSPGDFSRDIAKVLAYRSWIVEKTLIVPRTEGRLRIHEKEAEIKARIEGLLISLDTLVALPCAEQSQEVWARYAKDADELAADICGIIMLYLEHKLIKFVDNGEGESAEARRIFDAFIASAHTWAEESAVVGAVWVRAFMTILASGFVMGIIAPSIDESVDLLSLEAGFIYAVSAISTYAPALLVALHMHDHWSRTDAWVNMASNDWTKWMGPASGLFLVAAAVSVLCGVALNLYWSMVSFGPDVVLAIYWEVALNGAIYDGPRSVVGAILALGVLALLDWRRSGANESWCYTAVAVTVAAVVLWAGLAEALSSQYARAVACDGDQDCLDGIATIFGLLQSKTILVAGLQEGAIGLAALLVCRRALASGVGGLHANARRAVGRA